MQILSGGRMLSGVHASDGSLTEILPGMAGTRRIECKTGALECAATDFARAVDIGCPIEQAEYQAFRNFCSRRKDGGLSKTVRTTS